MTKEEFFKLADKYAKGTASKEEISFFEEFLEQMHEHQQNWNLEADEKIRLRILQKINRRINKPQTNYKSYRGIRVGAIAASVLVLIFAGLFVYNLNKPEKPVKKLVEFKVKKTERGQKSIIYLSDGTTIKLNAESELIYSSFAGKAVREVELKGEAFFDVARDTLHPFIVKTGNVKTQVLGTSFNINSYAENKDLKVTVATGKVQVSDTISNQSVFLTPNEQASFNFKSEALTKQTVDLQEYISWKDNIIYFNKVTINEAVAILEKWYGVKIQLENKAIGDCIISGKYSNDNLKNILDGIKYIKNIDYEFTSGQTIILKGKSCN